MFSNPFSPLFGGKPHVFFGRDDVLRRFDLAMVDVGSDDRALFITGARGDGKTALVEQLSQRARSTGRRVIDLGPESTAESLLRSLVRHAEATRTISPQASVSLMGVGAGLSAGSVSTTTRFEVADLQDVFLSACQRESHGMLVTVDEVQKVAEEDISLICNVFQMASRKGLDVMLVVAGLPYAHEQVIRYKGCTFMRRAVHEELSLFTRNEARESFLGAFSTIRGLVLEDEAADELVSFSMGHPYIMQLLGYYLVLEVNRVTGGGEVHVTRDDVRSITPFVRTAYEQRALRPMVEELTDAQRAYLRAAANIIESKGDGGNVVRSGEVAQALGKDVKQTSAVRESLMHLGLLLAPAHGAIMFGIPYLRTYLTKEPETSDVLLRAREWNV